MPNTAAICTSFKKELLNAEHAFGVPPARTAVVDAFKIALLQPSGNASANTTNYSGVSAAEVVSAGYTPTGAALPWIAPATANGIAYTTPSNNITWNGVTFTTDCAFIYNSTQGGKAVAAYTFASQPVVGGNFTLTMPPNNETLGLLRVA